MKVYIVNIETRKGDGNDILGPFTTFGKALQAIREHFYCWTQEELDEYDEFDSDISKGQIYTEEESVEIIERELE
jgi:hypothetical protein